MENECSKNCFSPDDIYDIIDGEASNELCSDFYEHIKVCEKCRNEYESIKALKKMLRNCTSEPSADFTTNTLARLKTVERNPFIRFTNSKSFKVIASAAACVVLALIVITGGLIDNGKLLSNNIANENDMNAESADMALYTNNIEPVSSDYEVDSTKGLSSGEEVSKEYSPTGDEADSVAPDIITKEDSNIPAEEPHVYIVNDDDSTEKPSNPNASDAGGNYYWDESENTAPNPPSTDVNESSTNNITPTAPVAPPMEPDYTMEEPSSTGAPLIPEDANPIQITPSAPSDVVPDAEMPAIYPETPSVPIEEPVADVTDLYKPAALGADYKLDIKGQYVDYTFAVYTNDTESITLAWSNNLASLEKFDELGFSLEHEYLVYNDSEVCFADYNDYRYIYWEKDGKYFVLRMPIVLTTETTGLELTDIEFFVLPTQQ